MKFFFCDLFRLHAIYKYDFNGAMLLFTFEKLNRWYAFFRIAWIEIHAIRVEFFFYI